MKTRKAPIVLALAALLGLVLIAAPGGAGEVVDPQAGCSDLDTDLDWPQTVMPDRDGTFEAGREGKTCKQWCCAKICGPRGCTCQWYCCRY